MLDRIRDALGWKATEQIEFTKEQIDQEVMDIMFKDIPQLSTEHQQHIRNIADSDNYEGLRQFLINYAATAIKAARVKKGEEADSLNDFANKIENMVVTIDAFKKQPEEEVNDDPYVV